MDLYCMQLCGTFYVNHLPTLLLVKSPYLVSSEAITVSAGHSPGVGGGQEVHDPPPHASGEAVVHVMAGPPQALTQTLVTLTTVNGLQFLVEFCP